MDFKIGAILSIFLIALELTPSWTQKCPTLTLKNGRVRVRSRGRMIHFRCLRGFSRVGQRFAVCLKSGQWSQETPTCVGRGCPKLTDLQNLSVQKMYGGGLLKFTCDVGLRVGPESIMCNGNDWDQEPPKCLEGMSMGCEFEEESLCGWSNDNTDDFDWTWNQGGTPTGNTGPQNDHTTNSSKGHYIFVESSAPQLNGHKARFISPTYEPDQVEGLCLEFFYHMYGHDDPGEVGELDVYMMTVSDPRFLTDDQRIFHRHGNQGDRWARADLEIPDTTETFKFVFQATRLRGWSSDIALDDIKLYNCSENSFILEETTAASLTTTSISPTTPSITTRTTTIDTTTTPTKTTMITSTTTTPTTTTPTTTTPTTTTTTTTTTPTTRILTTTTPTTTTPTTTTTTSTSTTTTTTTSTPSTTTTTTTTPTTAMTTPKTETTKETIATSMQSSFDQTTESMIIDQHDDYKDEDDKTGDADDNNDYIDYIDIPDTGKYNGRATTDTSSEVTDGSVDTKQNNTGNKDYIDVNDSNDKEYQLTDVPTEKKVNFYTQLPEADITDDGYNIDKSKGGIGHEIAHRPEYNQSGNDSNNDEGSREGGKVGQVKSNSDGESASSSGSGGQLPLIIGVTVGVFFLASVVALAAYLVAKRQKRKREEKEADDQINMIVDYGETSLNR